MPMEFRGQQISTTAILLAIFSSIGGLTFGYDSGSPLASSCIFSDSRTGLIVGMLSIGSLVGALASASIADRLGRKKTFVVDCVVLIIGTLIQALAFNSYQQIILGRGVAGLGVGGLTSVVILYQTETAPKELRGALVATFQLFITLGILLAYLISYGTKDLYTVSNGRYASGSWRIVVCIQILFALVLAIGIMFAPESPRWLIANGKPEEAERSIARIQGVKVEDNNPTVKANFNEILEWVKTADTKATWAECFRVEKRTLYRTILGMTLQSIQQLTGATIFQSVGLSDAYVTQIILGAVNFISTFFGIYAMERFGRRKPLIIGGLWQSWWLFVFATAGTIADPRENKTIGLLLIVSACLFIAGYASSWAPGIWIVVGETFPTRTRAKQGALATASNWMFNFLLAFFTSYITSAISFSYGYVFAVCNLAGAIIVFFFLYESSNLSLEAVDEMYNSNIKAWRSEKWSPEGHDSREEYNEAILAEKKALGTVAQRELADGKESSNDGSSV